MVAISRYPTAPPYREHTIRLQDGRTLAYTDHGRLHDFPVFLIHGNPGSRYMHHPDHNLIRNLGVRLIVIDRPGFGRSSFHRGRTVLTLPDDVIQLANRLNIVNFSVFGVSAGGPYVAAMAFKHPERVRSAAIVSGVAPFNRENAYDGVNSSYRAAYKISQLPSWMVLPYVTWSNYALITNRNVKWRYLMENTSDSDRLVLSNPIIRAQVDDFRLEAVRSGMRGVLQETRLVTGPWGFDLSDITMPIHLWYWEDDRIVSMQMGEYLHEQLPHSVPHFSSGGGHFSIYPAWEDILQSLTADL